MSLPTSVPILGIQFEVIATHLPVEADCGESHCAARSIFIDKDIPEDTQMETLYHEITHMILSLSGVSEFLEEKAEEAVCQAMGLGLFTMFRDIELAKGNE